MYHVAAVHAVNFILNGVHKNLKKNIAYMCNCRSSEIWRDKYLWYTLMCIFINLWGAFKVYYHCSTVISFYGGRGISFYRALLYQDRWFDGMKEHWVRDPGLPNLRMVSWNLKTLSFGGDWTTPLILWQYHWILWGSWSESLTKEKTIDMFWGLPGDCTTPFILLLTYGH